MEKPQRSEIHMVIAMICCFAATTFADELPVRLVTIDKQPPERPYAKIVADFNGDGLPDIAIGGAKGPLVWYAYPTWKKRLVAEGGYQTVEGEPADIDNDGKADVVIAEMHQGTDPDEVRVYLNQGGGLTWTREVLSTTGSHDIVLADIGADGDIDIVGANHAGSFQAVQLWENLTGTTGKGDR